MALLSGEMVVEQRAAVIERFREGKEKVLVTTNVCARGEQRLGPGPPGSGPQRDRVWEAAMVWGRCWFVGAPVGSLRGGERPQKPGVLAGGEAGACSCGPSAAPAASPDPRIQRRLCD